MFYYYNSDLSAWLLALVVDEDSNHRSVQVVVKKREHNASRKMPFLIKCRALRIGAAGRRPNKPLSSINSRLVYIRYQLQGRCDSGVRSFSSASSSYRCDLMPVSVSTTRRIQNISLASAPQAKDLADLCHPNSYLSIAFTKPKARLEITT